MTRDGAPAAGDRSALNTALDRLGNDDIAWSATLLGLTPEIRSPDARSILDDGDAAIPGLLLALEDDDRYVAAHVLLTSIAATGYAVSPWNGLDVDMRADGIVTIDPAQRPALLARWQAWAATRPAGMAVDR